MGGEQILRESSRTLSGNEELQQHECKKSINSMRKEEERDRSTAATTACGKRRKHGGGGGGGKNSPR